MKILKLKFRNFKSYGNKINIIDFEKDVDNQLILLQGNNGSGKCISSDTEMFISIEDESVRNKFKEFMKNRHTNN